MSKRFRDKEIWQKPWYRKLSSKERDAWNYICDWCDSVGVWTPDGETLEYFCGEGTGWDGLPGKCNGNIAILSNGKWWIVDFCDFQYGELSADCKPHAAYISMLKRHGVWDLYREKQADIKGYPKGMDTLQEKEKEKDKEKEKEKSEVKHKFGEYGRVLLTDSERERLVEQFGKGGAERWIKELDEGKERKGYAYKSDYLAIRQWAARSGDKGKAETVAGRPDAWGEDELARHRAEQEEAEQPTKEELAELERLKEAAARKSPVGLAVARMLGTG